LNKSSLFDEYYEQAWSQIAGSIGPQEQERIKQTLSLIPEDCPSILDVGCGDGRITNCLVSQYRKVVGLDDSREALRHVKAEKIVGAIECLPFPDRSFDLVLCCEVLEHLPFRAYPNGLKELERVAAKYIIVTVPNSQDIKRGMVTCPQCGCVFHVNRHLRSFTPERLRELFVKFRPEVLRPCLLLKSYPGWLLKVAKFVRILPKNPFPPTALCPQCGYFRSPDETSLKANILNKNSLLINFLRPLASRLIPARKRATWLVALYQRTEKV
jgi:SAM-dependent methyltransferase